MTLYMPLFRNCTATTTLLQLHAHLFITGRHRHPLPATKLIDSYAHMGCIQSARLVFDTFSTPDSFMWGVLIKAYVWNLFFKEAISLYHQMLHLQLHLSNFIFPSLLRACSSLCDERYMGRKIHASVIKSGYEFDCVVETALLQMYGDRGSLADARQIFDRMSNRDVVLWSLMVSNYVRNGQGEEAIETFRQMNLENVVPDSIAMISVTQACSELGYLQIAKSVHGYMLRREIEINESLANSLVSMYSKCGALHTSVKLFNKRPWRSVISWTSMIACYNQWSCCHQALDIYVQMQESEVRPNSVTMVGVLLSCAQLGYLREGRSVHGFVIRRGLDPGFDLVATALIDMYVDCGKIGDCYKVFETIQDKTVVSWNSLIRVYAQSGFSREALTLFVRMRIEGLFPDSFTLASSLSACGHIGASQLGSQLHAHIAKTGFQSNEFVENSLIDMYCKCGFVDIARSIFNKMQKKGLVTWNSMISGFSRNGNSTESIILFNQMHSEGLEMDGDTFVGAIQAGSHLGSLEKGKWLHHKHIMSGLEKDWYVDTALIDMYAKCGDIQMARGVFANMIERNVVSWSAMISGYGIHGLIDDAIMIFNQMMESGIRPNEVTFISILSACSHAGYVEEGNFYFNLMRSELHIEPNLEHCACMVDLLSRAGHLDSAYDFIKSMPVAPNASIWGALINGCRIHHRMDMINTIQTKILDLEPNNSGTYILLSNIYAEGGNWNEFGKVRSMMKHMGLIKTPGCSLIELNKRIYKFSSGDTCHLQTNEIYRFLAGIESLAQEQGVYALPT